MSADSSAGPTGSPDRGIGFRARLTRFFISLIVRPALKPGRPISRQRAWVRRLAMLARPPKTVTSRTLALGGVPCDQLDANREPPACVLYFHSGGYCVGSPAAERELTGCLARDSGCRVIAPHYRLAPEAPFPAALDDAVSVYGELLADGMSAGQIVIGGASAGGGLALALALRTRAKDMPLPAGIFCLSPWVDLALTGATLTTLAERDPMLRAAWLEHMAASYAGRHPRTDPLISPLYGDFGGFPPVLIQVGSEEILRADAERLAQRLERQGVASELNIGSGLWHIWQLHAASIPESGWAAAQIVAFLHRCVESARR